MTIRTQLTTLILTVVVLFPLTAQAAQTSTPTALDKSIDLSVGDHVKVRNILTQLQQAVAKHDTAAVANLPKGGRTATIESKTNFFAAIPLGDTAYAECTPLHRGRTTTVWQTKITRGDGRLCALVTQTQIVILPEKS